VPPDATVVGPLMAAFASKVIVPAQAVALSKTSLNCVCAVARLTVVFVLLLKGAVPAVGTSAFQLLAVFHTPSVVSVQMASTARTEWIGAKNPTMTESGALRRSSENWGDFVVLTVSTVRVPGRFGKNPCRRIRLPPPGIPLAPPPWRA